MKFVLASVIPLVVRHVLAYVELAADETTVLLRGLGRRLLAAAMALIAGLVTVLLGCLWLIAEMWDTRWRGLTIAVLFFVFAIATAVCGARARHGRDASQGPFARLRSEWENDHRLLQAAFEPEPADVPQTSSDYQHVTEH
jgi:uncharacterized membrane protein YqjE